MEKYILAALFFLNISKIVLSTNQGKRIIELVSIPTEHLNKDNSTNVTVSCRFTCDDEIPLIKLLGTYNLEELSGFELYARKVFNGSGFQKDSGYLCMSSGENVTVEVSGSVDRTLRDEECSFTAECSADDSSELVNATFPYQDNLSAGDPCSGLVVTAPNSTIIITVVSTTTIHPTSAILCISAVSFSSLPSPTVAHSMSSTMIKITDDISQSIYISSHNGSAMINNAKETREDEKDTQSLQFYIIVGVLSLCAILSLLLNVVLLMCVCKRRRHNELNINGIPNITYKNS